MPEENLKTSEDATVRPEPAVAVWDAGLSEDQAQTHVFLIGIGHYPHGQTDAMSDSVGKVEDLTSPCRTVMALYDFFMETKEHWVPQLGSIYLLLSPPDRDPRAGEFRELAADATFANIDAALRAWQKRCNAHDENTAFFYFCGHGFDDGSQYLPASDFGVDPDYKWDYVLDFDATRRTLKKMAAQTHCFFVDACRVRPPNADTQPPSGRRLGGDQKIALVPNDLTLLATSQGKAAYGPNMEPSYFAQALLQLFKGMAARDVDDDWMIDTGLISGNMSHSLRFVDPNSTERQAPVARDPRGSANILRLPDGPLVPVRIFCKPEEAMYTAHFRFSPSLNGDSNSRTAPHRDAWKLVIPKGNYTFEAFFPDHEFQDSSRLVEVRPPHVEKSIKVEKP